LLVKKYRWGYSKKQDQRETPTANFFILIPSSGKKKEREFLFPPEPYSG
jgi:hypothetical protein